LGSPAPSTRGGGAIHLLVDGNLSLDGSISANGAGATRPTSGSASGGSVWLNVKTLSGTGVISANGGSASNLVSGGGGGGRVAIDYLSTNLFTGSIQARGGTGTNSGGPGSIYLRSITNSLPQIIFDNGGVVGSTYLATNFDNSDVAISGGTWLTNSGTLFLRSLFVGSNAWFTTPMTTVLSGTISNVTIQAGGGIIADGRSLIGIPKAGVTSGGGATSGSTGGGGGGAGNGGNGLGIATGGIGTSSRFLSATDGGGTGAGPSSAPLGGLGGGVILLTIPNKLILDGSISANGIGGGGLSSGGGGGGSIYLKAKTITGTGFVSANGGPGVGGSGGGGGGAIELLTDTNLFTGPVTAFGGSGATFGGAGVILSDSYNGNIVTSRVLVDNGGNRGARTPLSLTEFSDLTIIGGAMASNAPSGFTSGQLRNIFIGSNSSFQTFSSSQLTISVLTNLTIAAGGSINADGANSSVSGLGAGQTLSSTGGGGGSAGTGGPSSLGAAGGNGSSDSIATPATLGGRGGAGALGQIQGNGGNGGGLLRITVGATLRVDGTLSAEGAPSSTLNGGGGGGGSLAITAKTLAGAGLISANGGAGNTAGGGGGGGHIAVSYNTNLFSGTLSARGGSGANFGGAGLVYVAAGQSVPQLTIDNGGVVGGYTPLNTQIQAVNLSVTGGAILTNSILLPPIQNLFIGSNSTWLAYASPAADITIQSNATVQVGGLISADGIVSSGAAPGLSIPARGGGGGGHGGYGGASFSNAPGGNVTMDSITGPTGSGSPGGSGTGAGNFGGTGGGVLLLTVRGTLQLDGRISANGRTALSNLNSGGGSGGSVWLHVGKISGTGTLSADGGAANNLGGGGGGGRMAVWYNTNSFAGTISARGGLGANAGGAGTVYLNQGMLGLGNSGKLIFDNGGAHGTNTTIVSSISQADLIITNGTSVALGISQNSTWKSLIIASNSVLNASPNFNIVHLVVSSNVDIQTGGALTLDNQGSPANFGPGRGFYFTASGGGGGHGGLGSAGTLANATGGVSFDSVSSPTAPGSGGGSVTPTEGSGGGGAILLTINGALNVDGTLSANGGSATTAGAGGGSGGSIAATARSISGHGRISADGGDGDIFSSGGGGGGRIALISDTNLFAGTISARGGAGATLSGGAGTIYLLNNSSAFPQVLVDNGGQFGVHTPLSNLNGTPAPVDLALRHEAVGDPGSNLHLRSLLIDSGASMVQQLSGPTMNLTVINDALVDTNGAIFNDAAGLSPDNGPGSGSADASSGVGSGGGYGGMGGASIYGTPGGGTYGSSNQPVNFGGSGGVYPPLAGYSRGGGAIRLAVGGTLTVNGIVSANGEEGMIDGSGGGAGGSIWISAHNFLGNGWITADGGMGEGFEGGGGGGGRIAIYTPTNSFTGNLLALGGDGANAGQNGTVYVPTSLLVSGSVRSNGTAVAGLTLQPSALASVATDSNGFYTIIVPPLWTGSVTPIGNGVMVPSMRGYLNLMSNAVAEDFTLTTPEAFNLAGNSVGGTNLSFNWFGLSGAVYQPEYSSNLVDWVPYGAPFAGSNAPASVIVPLTNAPQLYFRLHVVY
jgi:hypothetical protein